MPLSGDSASLRRLFAPSASTDRAILSSLRRRVIRSAGVGTPRTSTTLLASKGRWRGLGISLWHHGRGRWRVVSWAGGLLIFLKAPLPLTSVSRQPTPMPRRRVKPERLSCCRGYFPRFHSREVHVSLVEHRPSCLPSVSSYGARGCVSGIPKALPLKRIQRNLDQ